MPRHFVRVNDDLLLIEIIRRLRRAPIPNVAYRAYPGVDTGTILNTASPLFKEVAHLRSTLTALLEDKTLTCFGSCSELYAPGAPRHRMVTSVQEGIVTYLHPDAPLTQHSYFTPSGTAISQHHVRSKSAKCVHMLKLNLGHLYVTEDGLPAKVMTALERAAIIFSRTTPIQTWVTT